MKFQLEIIVSYIEELRVNKKYDGQVCHLTRGDTEIIKVVIW